jgi:Na+-translocating ferredoxin:NAD+ oxidoreductase RnfA subunit
MGMGAATIFVLVNNVVSAQIPGIYLPLITINCAVLDIAEAGDVVKALII